MQKIKSLIAKLTKKQIIIISTVSVLLIGCLSFFLLLNTNTSAVSSKSEIVNFEVVEGDTLDSITNRLEKKKYIKNASFAKLAAKMDGTSQFVVGNFAIDKNWSANKILRYLCVSKNILKNEALITFQEGIWAKEIACILGNDERYKVSEEELITLWNDDTFLKEAIKKYDFLDESILNSQYRVKLEGYLFPETYSIPFDATAEEITHIFLSHFDAIYTDLKDDIKKSNMRVHDVITLASVVQYEASASEDMKLVAGVFLNRLQEGMKLGSSVTVCYALYNDLDKSDPNSWKDCEAKFDIDSPYNTYVYDGLPIGPIENPGRIAIEAVLSPTKSDYLYFMADVHGDGAVYYAKTYEEHAANTKKYLGY